MGQNLSILLYSSQKQASVGDIVEINIRNNVDYGLILSENLEYFKDKEEVCSIQNVKILGVSNSQNRILDNDKDHNKIVINTSNESKSKKFEVKEINKILAIKLSHSQIKFLKIFAENTFNSLNDTWDAISQSYSLLTQKQWKILDEIAILNQKPLLEQFENTNLNMNTYPNNKQKAQNDPLIEDKKIETLKKNIVLENSQLIAPKVEFLIDLDIKVRIMYIIRSLKSEIQKPSKALKLDVNRQILIVFPEKKYLNKVYKYLQLEINKDIELSKIIELLYYTSEPTKKTKECIWSMLDFEINFFKDHNPIPKLQIICSTRSGLFLPFFNLKDIVLIDEGNSMYIQDQNSLYYDTREAIFLISKAFNANISFISPLPSIRLYNMYNKQVLEKEMINNLAIAQKPRKIKITRFDKKSSKYNLFGYEIEQILEKIKI